MADGFTPMERRMVRMARSGVDPTTQWIIGVLLVIGVLAQSGGMFVHMAIGKPGTFPNDSIELELLKLAKTQPNAKDIAAQVPDLQRMAEYVRGIAAVTPSYGPTYAKDKAAQEAYTHALAAAPEMTTRN